MPKIRALFFDMDQTLARDSESTRLSVQRVLPLLQARFSDLDYETLYPIYRRVNNRHWENFDESLICRCECSVEARTYIWNETLQALGCEDRDFARAVAVAFQRAREETYRCYDDTLPVLRELHRQYPMVLVTNGHSQMQRAKIRVTGLEPFFRAVLVAQEVKVSKPSPRFFRLALDAAGTNPEETLMVGDHPEKDILGARGAGLPTAWMRRYDSTTPRTDPRPEYVVHDLYEVKAILESLHA